MASSALRTLVATFPWSNDTSPSEAVREIAAVQTSASSVSA